MIARDRGQLGERHGRAILTATSVMMLRARRCLGMAVAPMASVLGVSAATVQFAADGRNWKHLPQPSESEAKEILKL